MKRLGLGLTAVILGSWFLGRADAGGFPTSIEKEIGAMTVKLALTGTAVRKKGIFAVYSVASYLLEGAKVRSAEELAGADVPKQLHLVMIRSVSGQEMGSTFLAVFRQNHPEPAFKEEAQTLADLLRASTAQRGDNIFITHVPKVGLHCRRAGGEEILIKNVDFSKAVWDNYFGKRSISEDVKRGLTSRLR